MRDRIETFFQRLASDVHFCSLRLVEEHAESLQVRQDVLQPARRSNDVGVMVTVIDGSGLGYAATSDVSESGLTRAFDEAREWAGKTAQIGITDFSKIPLPSPQGSFTTPVAKGWSSASLGDKIDLLRGESQRLNIDSRIVDWSAALWYGRANTLYLTNQGGRVEQDLHFIVPSLSATANEGVETQTRSLGGRGCCRQGGLEVLDDIRFREVAPELASEALELLAAPNCPSGVMDLLLAPDQMILQIHESIGHPLELDRILGDERNYAGTSFVTMDMFGSYRYGSQLLNVTHDPTVENEFASYGFDDDGAPATKEFIIRNGILERPLGGIVSQHRAGMNGVANSRACSWNRPPIDRMANLNLEVGNSNFEQLVGAIEQGVYMRANNSWSIDDSRNKFQFGCEWAQLIENGELTQVVKKPNYRGISATFWRNLKMVGDSSTRDILGTPHCGKGEPNQAVRVGHASPTCLFADVDVFGGE